jgi:hypothetical protein
MILNLKYQLNYGNISGDTFKCDIYKVGTYDGEPIVLDGYCVLSYKNVTSVFEPIRGASLGINFLADASGILEDLNLIQEFQFFVVLFRNEKPIFTGWVLPDGIFQDYVKDEWNVSLQAVDGLGFLKNYEYVPQISVILEDSVPFVSDVYPQEFNILYTILARTGYQLPIATFDDINQGFNPSDGEPFGSVDFANINSRIVNKEVFINKNENYFDCETILKDILQKYNFTISQGLVNDELCWIVSRPAFQLNASNQKGSIWKPTSIDGNKIIFERTDTFPNNNNIVCSDSQASTVAHNAIHCNANQNIIYNPAIQNFRFDQKWLGLKNFGVTMTDDDYDVTTEGMFVDDGIRSDLTGGTPALSAEQTTLIVYEKGFSTNLKIEINTKFIVTAVSGTEYKGARIWYAIRTVNINDGTVLYLKLNDNNVSEWTNTFTRLQCADVMLESVGDFFNTTVFETPDINNVEIYVDIYESTRFSGLISYQAITTGIKIFYDATFLGIGEWHDSKLVNFKSSFLNEPVKVINANQNDDVFLNNLYRNDGGNLIPQSSWNTKDTAPIYDDLLELTSRERLDMLQLPQMVFSGDIYGYIPYFTTIKYDRIDGLFLPLQYSYNTLTNVSKIEASQAFSSIVNKTYEQTYYFEDEKNVLIKEI